MHISTEEEQTTEGERTVTLTGTPESVLLAQFLVQSNVDLFKKDQANSRVPRMLIAHTPLFRVVSWTLLTLVEGTASGLRKVWVL